MEYFLNIMGSEWMIIIFVALILLFGTNKLPEAGKKIGKMVGEYNKAKTEMQNQIKSVKGSYIIKEQNCFVLYSLSMTFI